MIYVGIVLCTSTVFLLLAGEAIARRRINRSESSVNEGTES